MSGKIIRSYWRSFIKTLLSLSVVLIFGFDSQSQSLYGSISNKNPMFHHLQANLESLNKLNLLICLDTSGSMKKIFPEVKSNLIRFVQQAEDGYVITLFTFDENTKVKLYNYKINPTNRIKIIDTIRSIQANGKYTDLHLALSETRILMRSLRESNPMEQGYVFILTDNIHDPPPYRKTQNTNTTPLNFIKDHYEALHWHVYALDINDIDPGSKKLSTIEKIKQLRAYFPNYKFETRKISEGLNNTISSFEKRKLFFPLMILFLTCLVNFLIFKSFYQYGLINALKILSLTLTGTLLIFGAFPIFVISVFKSIISIFILFPFYLFKYILHILYYDFHPFFLVLPVFLLITITLFILKKYKIFPFLNDFLERRHLLKDITSDLKNSLLHKKHEHIHQIYYYTKLREIRKKLISKMPINISEYFHLIQKHLREFDKVDLINILKADRELTAIFANTPKTLLLLLNKFSIRFTEELFKNECIPVTIRSGRNQIDLVLKDGSRVQFKIGSELILPEYF